MFDPKTISQVIGEKSFAEVNDSDLPKLETMTLLHIWTHSSPVKLRTLAATNKLLPVLKRHCRDGLEQAADLRMNNSHLTQTECLQTAGLPLHL